MAGAHRPSWRKAYSAALRIASALPVTMTERPAAMTERPVTKTERPVTVTERPVTMGERPVAAAEQPVTTTVAVAPAPSVSMAPPVALPASLGVESSVTAAERSQAEQGELAQHFPLPQGEGGFALDFVWPRHRA